MTILSRVRALISGVKQFFYNRYIKPVSFEVNPSSITLIIPITDATGITYKGVTQMKILTNQGVVAGDIILLDAQGNTVAVEGTPQWTVGPQGIVNVIPSADGKSARLEATGTPGDCTVTVFANGLSSAIQITAEAPVVITPPVDVPPVKAVAVSMSVPLSEPYNLQGQAPTAPVTPVQPAPDAPVTFDPNGNIAPQAQ